MHWKYATFLPKWANVWIHRKEVKTTQVCGILSCTIWTWLIFIGGHVSRINKTPLSYTLCTTYYYPTFLATCTILCMWWDCDWEWWCCCCRWLCSLWTCTFINSVDCEAPGDSMLQASRWQWSSIYTCGRISQWQSGRPIQYATAHINQPVPQVSTSI